MSIEVLAPFETGGGWTESTKNFGGPMIRESRMLCVGKRGPGRQARGSKVYERGATGGRNTSSSLYGGEGRGEQKEIRGK